jgi:hypothetical protein
MPRSIAAHAGIWYGRGRQSLAGRRIVGKSHDLDDQWPAAFTAVLDSFQLRRDVLSDLFVGRKPQRQVKLRVVGNDRHRHYRVIAWAYFLNALQ